MLDLNRVLAVKKASQARLLAIPGVHAVGVGGKLVGGRSTAEPAIMVFLTEKRGLADLAPHEVVPADIEGVKTDVVELGAPPTLARCSTPACPAASPAWMRTATRTAPFTGWRIEGQPTQPLTGKIPLEDLVETEAFGEDLALRVEIGQTVEVLLRLHGVLEPEIAQVRAAFAVPERTEEQLAADPDRDAARFERVVMGRALDGLALYRAAAAAAPTRFAPPYGADWKKSQISFAAWMSRLELPSRRRPRRAGCGALWPPSLMV